MKLFINGTLVNSTPHSGDVQNTGGSFNWRIGNNGEGTDRSFDGKLDELRIYARALSDEQIYQHWLETKDGDTNSSTIVSEETSNGDIWTCEVHPNDGLDYGLIEWDKILIN